MINPMFSTCASASTRDTRSSLHLFSTHALHLSSCLLSFVSYLVISRRLSLISHRSSFFISHDSSLSHTHTLSLIVRSSLLCSSLLSCVRLDSSSLFHLIASLNMISDRKPVMCICFVVPPSVPGIMCRCM